MNDDAVAPVIAVMLILAAVVTFLVVWNGIYVPSMKQGAEIGHLQNVESAFLHFSSDIERAVSARQNLTLSEPVPLGGGDFFFNTLRSSGSISVQNEQRPVYYLTLDDETNEDIIINGALINISYEPVENFWQDQGYRWQYGYLNVTKYRTKQTPLRYYTMTDINNQFEEDGSLAVFARSFGSVEYTKNQTSQIICTQINANTTPNCTIRQITGNCSSIVLWGVTISPSPNHEFISSNGFGTLELKSTVTSVPYYGVSNITIGSGGDPFGNATFRNWNSSFATITGACENNIQLGDSHDGFSSYIIEQEVSPVNVTLNIVNIEVGAY